jgi:hypothetical protein
LFETVWGIIEVPKKTFRRIAMAEHKNFAFVMFLLFGISLSFTTFWFFELGHRFTMLPDLIVAGFVAGMAAGVLLVPILTLTHFLVARILGGKGSLKTGYGILAYSATPIVAGLFLVLPIELLTFGMYLFTSNPHPFVIKPVSYMLLVSFDAMAAIWSLLLLIVGTKVGFQLSSGRAAICATGVLIAACGSVFATASILL